MSYEEKHNILSLLTLIVVSVPYMATVFTQYASMRFATAQDELGFWAVTILTLIPVRIVAEIIGHILMAIVIAVVTGKDKLDTRTDERDYLISLRATRNSYFVFGFAMFVAFALMTVSPSISLMCSVLLIGGILAELTDIGSKIIMYRATS